MIQTRKLSKKDIFGGRKKMKINKIKIVLLTLVVLFMLSTNTYAAVSKISKTQESFETNTSSEVIDDYDPLVNLSVSVNIKEIRAYDKIDKTTEPDFYLKVFINDEVHKSPVYKNQKIVK